MRKVLFTLLLFNFFSSLPSVIAQNLTITVEDEIISCEQGMVDLEITVDNFIDMGSFQFAVLWDENVLEFSSADINLPPSGLSNENFVNSGEYRLGWADFSPPSDGETLPNGSVILTLHFTQIGGGGSFTDVEVSGVPGFPFQFADNGGIIPPNQITINQGMVEVFDIVDPQINGCPPNITSMVAPPAVTAMVDWTAPGATDNCNVASFSSNFAPMDVFPLGTTTVNYTATDDAGNSTSCSFDVTVSQSASAGKPRFELDNRIVDCNGDTVMVDLKVYNFDTISTFQFGIKWDTSVIKYVSGLNFMPPTGLIDESRVAGGAVGVAWLDFNPPAGESLPDGTTVFKMTFDITGLGGDMTNIIIDSLDGLPIEISKPSGVLDSSEYVLVDGSVSINDDENPVIMNCPSSIQITVPFGTVDTMITWTAPTATDNCNVASFTSNFDSGDSFPVGMTTVQYEARDDAGNMASCNFNIDVVEDQPRGPLTFRFQVDTVNCTQSTVDAFVKVANFDSITTMQYGMLWDTSVLTYVSHEAYLPPTTSFETNNTAGGELGIAWLISQNPFYLSLPDDSCIIKISFTIDGMLGDTALLSFGGLAGFPTEVSNVEMGVIDSADINFESAVFSIRDLESPSITNCPPDIMTNVASDSCTTRISWPMLTATDDCDDTVSISQTSMQGNGDFFGPGSYTIEYVASDDSGKTDTCRFNIAVTDPHAPVIADCPVDTIVYVGQDSCNLAVSWDSPTASDNCSVDTFYSNVPNGSIFSLGLHTITYIAADESGNADTCSFTISVADTIPPTFMNCPPDTVLYVAQDTCEIQYIWTAPTAEDNCAVKRVFTDVSNGSLFGLGTTTVTYTAIDSSDNEAYCTFNVTVRDTIPPTFMNCPPDTVLYVAQDTCEMQYIWTAPTADDNCAVKQVFTDVSNGSLFGLGTTTVTYTAIDSSDNEAYCTFNVTVRDTIPPTFMNCPPDTVLYVTQDTCEMQYIWTAPTAEDNCAVKRVFTDVSNGSLFGLGTTMVTYTAIDSSDNEAYCTFSVTVLDTIPPTFMNCPPDTILYATQDTCELQYIWTSPTAEDNCSVKRVFTDVSNGSLFGLGTTTVTYTAIDSSDNESYCTFDVTVLDTIAPVIQNCPVDIIAFVDADSCMILVDWMEPMAGDNCGVDTFYSNIANGAVFSLGQTTVNYIAEDESGNQAMCDFQVTVNDTIAPTFSNCPNDITVQGDPDSCYQEVSWNNPSFIDNCGLDTVLFSHIPGDTFPVGVTNVTITGRDDSGNEATCTFNVEVEDTSVPVFGNCPIDFTVLADPDSCSRTVFWVPPVISGGCAGAITVDVNVPPGTSLDVGQHLIIYTATSTNGNSASCTFVITVEDPAGPMFLDCPTDISLGNEPGKCSAVASWVPPTIDFSCGMDSLFVSHMPGDTFPVGTTEVQYILIGMTGDADTCSFFVEVQDVQQPVISNCPGDLTVFTDANSCEGVANWTAPTATDNCAVSGFIGTHMPGDTFSLGVTTVFYTAVDNNNNVSVCSFEVTVQDTVAPVITNCPGNVIIYTDGTVITDPDDFIFLANTDNCTGVQLFYSPPSATDNCGPINTLQVPIDPFISGDVFPVGLTTINFFAMDNAGNDDFCTIDITVIPVKDLFASASRDTVCAGENIQLTANSAVAGVTYQWTGPNGYTSTDKDNLLSNLDPVDSGIYQVVSTSPGGCTDTVQLNIRVNPVPNVEIIHTDVSCTNGMDDLVLSIVDSSNTAITTYNWSGPANFNSGLASPVITNVTPANSGQYALEVITDDGCIDSASVSIMVGVTPSLTSLTATNNDTSLCINEVTTLTGSTIAGANPIYNWQVTPTAGVVWNPMNQNSVDLSFTAAGDYTIFYFGAINGCPSDTLSIVLHVEDFPGLDLASNGPILCTQGTDSLFLFENGGTGLNYSYQWTGPMIFSSTEQNPVIPNVTADNAGFYYVTATNGDGCMSTDSIRVEITNGPVPQFPIISPLQSDICLGDSVQLEGQAYNAMNGVVYKWWANPAQGSGLTFINNNRSFTVIPTSAGSYEYFFFATVAGCPTDTASLNINVNAPPLVSVAYNDPLDCILPGTDLVLSENSGNGINWSWSGPAGFTSNQQNPIISDVGNANAGDYTVEITDANGCINEATISVEITEGLDQMMIDVNQLFHCDMEDTLVLTTPFIPGVVYSWVGPVAINTTGNEVIIPNVEFDYEGSYTVFGTNADGCISPVSDEAEVTIIEAPELERDVVSVLFETPTVFDVLDNDNLEPDQPFTIEVLDEPVKGELELNSDGTFSYSPFTNALESDFFTYQICYDACEFLCSSTLVSINIQYDQERCIIPNVITPNGDASNDMLVISCLESNDEPENEIIIFNEWGDEVYRAAPYQNDWDGTRKGEPLPDGTYYYVFTKNDNTKPIKGFVTIFR